MPVAVALLVLLSAFVHASWNAVLKTTRNPENAVLGIAATSLVTSAIVAILAHAPLPPRASLTWCLVAGVLEAGYSVTLARALTRAPFGPVYTIVRGGAVAIVWPFSVLLFREQLTPLKAAGTLVVILGLVSAGMSDRQATTADESKTKGRGFFMAGVCALFIGAYYLSHKAALSNGGKPEFVALISSSVSFVALLGIKGRQGRVVLDAMRTDAVRIVVAGVLSTLAFIAFLFAMSKSGAGLVYTLRNTSILFAQGISWLLGERPKRFALVGAAFVMIGAVLLAL